MIKVVSINIDGSLIDKNRFDEIFWYEELPLAYSRQFRLSLEKSKEIVNKEYHTLSLTDPEWHIPETWFKRLKMQPDADRMLHSLGGSYHFYRDVKPAIDSLNMLHKYKIIAITDSSKSVLRWKFKVVGIQGGFVRIISAIDDYDKMRKDAGIYQEMLSSFGVRPEEIVHIGDDKAFDHELPFALGIHAFLLDRNNKRSGTHVVHDLTEFLQKVKGLDKN